VKALMD